MAQLGGAFSVWQWCSSCCADLEAVHEGLKTRQTAIHSARNPAWNRGRRGSLGIQLTLKAALPTNRLPYKVKSLSALKPKKNPMTNIQRKLFLELSKLQPNKISLDQPRKVELSADMTTFIRDDSMHSRKNSSDAEKRSPRKSFLLQQSSSIFQQRMSTSKQQSSRGSLLLVRNEEDDERNDHMRIKSLFHSRRNNSANRMSLTNVLNSISEEAENNEHALNTPNELSRMISPLTRKLTTAVGFSRGTANKSSTGHTKTNSSNNTSVCTYGAYGVRTRHSSYAGISYKMSKKSLGQTSSKQLL